tara:strand:- start:191 stop:415 length:225 start_codon:yes stop_codon:yes gene_type:complete
MGCFLRHKPKNKADRAKGNVVFSVPNGEFDHFAALQHQEAQIMSAALWDWPLFAFRASASKKQQGRGKHAGFGD